MFLDMHGLIFYLSISPLAGSTRYLYYCWRLSFQCTFASNHRSRDPGREAVPLRTFVQRQLQSKTLIPNLAADTLKFNACATIRFRKQIPVFVTRFSKFESKTSQSILNKSQNTVRHFATHQWELSRRLLLASKRFQHQTSHYYFTNRCTPLESWTTPARKLSLCRVIE